MQISISALRPVWSVDTFRGRLFLEVIAGDPAAAVLTVQLAPEEAQDLLSTLQSGLQIVYGDPQEDMPF
jgi:hypothetical protein